MCFIAIYGALALGKAVLMGEQRYLLRSPSRVVRHRSLRHGHRHNQGRAPVGCDRSCGPVRRVPGIRHGRTPSSPKEYYLANATFCLLVIVEIVIGNMGSLTGGHGRPDGHTRPHDRPDKVRRGPRLLFPLMGALHRESMVLSQPHEYPCRQGAPDVDVQRSGEQEHGHQHPPVQTGGSS